MSFKQWLEMRQLGKSLPETGYNEPYAIIYRASSNANLKDRDYVTMSRKFAVGHAEHQAAVEEEPCGVYRYMVKSSDVYEAMNPGEYFYSGPPAQGRLIYTAE